MLSRQHVRQFLAVVDTGSFSRAAEKIGVTQPTLSAAIAVMERQVGTPLFVRDRRAIRLTAAGSRMLAPARNIERDFMAAEAAGASPSATPRQFRLGVIPSFSSVQLGAIVSQLWSGASLALVEGAAGELKSRLNDGKLDAAITLVTRQESEGPDFTLVEEGYAMMLPVGHRLADRDRLEPSELAQETMIARRSCEILPETSRFFTQRGIRPPFSLRLANDDRCLAMVAAGLGITTAPLSLVRDGIVAVPIAGYSFRRRVALSFPPGQSPTEFEPRTIHETCRDVLTGLSASR